MFRGHYAGPSLELIFLTEDLECEHLQELSAHTFMEITFAENPMKNAV
jgi:hypothetical protein